jgi:hypothetical protein
MHKSLPRHRRRDPHRGHRSGTILVITAIVSIVLFGLLGLVIDAGQLMSAQRMTRNATDAAATAAAMDLLTGRSHATATDTATAFVKQYNGLEAAEVTVSIPPASGPHAGSSQHVEVIVSNSVPLTFIQVLGVGSSRTVKGRAVGGWEGVAVAAGVIALDKGARPGVDITGNGSLIVNGTILVNSDGGGLTETGEPIDNGNSGTAITTSGGGYIYAREVLSVGGVSSSSAIKNYDTSNPQSPLRTGSVAHPDPYQYLPPPTTANGAVATNFGAIDLSGNANVTLSPGVYSSIKTSANVNVHLNPGVYVIAGGGITMSGNSVLTGEGVLLYNTGSDYNVNTGLPDSGDGTRAPPAFGSPSFGGVSITGNAALDLTPYSNSSSPFDGMVLYQRRLNTQPLKLAGNGSSDVLTGTVYAKWAPLDLSGNGTFNSQFVVQRVDITGNGTLTLDVTGQHLTRSDEVFLVE